jgi:hypothetical protein
MSDQPKRLTQDEMILRHLQTGESITAAQAVAEYGCYRLAACINRLRQSHPINSHNETATNRFGVTVHFARYRMAMLPPRMPTQQEDFLHAANH